MYEMELLTYIYAYIRTYFLNERMNNIRTYVLYILPTVCGCMYTTYVQLYYVRMWIQCKLCMYLVIQYTHNVICTYVQVGQFIDMAHLVLEDLPRAAVDCGRFTLLRTEGTPPPSLCSVSALSLELSAVCEVCMYIHCMLSVSVM